MSDYRRSFVCLKRERGTEPREEIEIAVPEKRTRTMNNLCNAMQNMTLDGGSINPGKVWVVFYFVQHIDVRLEESTLQTSIPCRIICLPNKNQRHRRLTPFQTTFLV